MNKEQDNIDRTIEFCHDKIKNEELPLIEKQALLFYIKELKKLCGCPDNQKFVKPGRCIGGYGDQMVFKPWILRDKKDNILTDYKGEMLTKSCCFQDMYTYLQYVRGEKKVEKQYVEFYNGMPQDEYLKLQMMKRPSYSY